MQNIPAGLIPYNHEKYLTGKYIAETRGGFRPKKIENMEGANQPLVYIDDENDISCCSEDGCWRSNGDGTHNNDIFLRPKTVKKWHPVLKDFLCDSEEKCIKSFGDRILFLKAVEVEVNED